MTASGAPRVSPGPAAGWLTVSADDPDAAGGSVVALPPAELGRLGLTTGGVVLVHGHRTTAARLLRTAVGDRGQGEARLSPVARANAAVRAGDRVQLSAAAAPDAVRVHITAGAPARLPAPPVIARALAGEPVMAGDRYPCPAAGGTGVAV